MGRGKCDKGSSTIPTGNGASLRHTHHLSPWIAEEFIVSDTVEDVSYPPRKESSRIWEEVSETLGKNSAVWLGDNVPKHLAVFSSVFDNLAYLRELVGQVVWVEQNGSSENGLYQALDRVEEAFRSLGDADAESAARDGRIQLLHQVGRLLYIYICGDLSRRGS